jgi:prefoldin subunit 5
MNTSSGMPRSTLDGIHDDGGVVIQKPGELGPSSAPTEPPYTESPPGSGVWVPDQRPYPPGSVRPAGWSGKAAEEADAADASLRKTREGLNQADEGLAQHITAAHAADAQSKTQLQRIQQEIRTGVAAMQPSLGTAAGREQLAEFLDRKGAEAKQVASNAQDKSARLASSMQAVGHQFELLASRTPTDPWEWDGDSDETWMEPIDPGGAGAGPNAGPAIPPSPI